ncbi:MAG: hypothetical protein K9H25_18055 [Rhodospirillum sp.]|nr:hypothetical protein [Rhodospirillum sp.]MCF8491083.1 hypothetical protein [Rhodospirillum sp.]MCF8500227.1 hypothetical protein [Rhodospirillum sp.]
MTLRAFSRRLRPVLATAVVFTLAGCGAFQADDKRKCPEIRIDASTADLTRFSPGPGRDVTDITLTGELAGFEGNCQYDDTGVTVDMYLSFSMALGPAAVERVADFQYFVAIPQFFPDPSAKQVYSAHAEFPSNVNRVRYRDEEVAIRLPLNLDESAAGTEIYVGFQLSPDELRYNQTKGAIGAMGQ